MKYFVLWVSFLLLVITGAPLATGGDVSSERAAKRLAKVEANYKATGVLKHCVSIRVLRNSRVLDDQTIFFEGRGSKGYINRLPRKCHNLVREGRFSYVVRSSQLCRSNIITIFDNFGRAYNSCSLGEFEEMQKNPKTENAPKAP